MTIRELPAAEWSRLAGTALDQICRLLTAQGAGARILVVEDGDTIVGHFGLFPVWHAEAMGIDPAYQKHGAVMRRLLHGMADLARQEGVKGVVTASIDPKVTNYLTRLGAVPQPGRAFIWPLEKESVCLPL